jgi:hypothetical protein
MSEDTDLRIANLLNVDAPPPRDPVFRVSVLERREHRQFQRRLFTMLAGALVILLISTFAISIGAGALGPMGALAVAGAVATACLAFRRSLPQVLRRFTF